MRSLLKAIGILIAIIVIFFAAVAIIVPIYFHPNDYKDEIAAFVQDKTGRELAIEGDIVLSVFPWLAIELGALELGNAPGFPDGKFARLEKMEIGVKILPLLSKHLEMRKVTVHGLELNLAKDKDGRTNWADLAGSQGEQEEEQAKDEPEESAQEEGMFPLAALGVGGLDIRDGALEWHDAQTNQHYELKGLTIETGEIVPDTTNGLAIEEPLDVKISFDFEGNSPPLRGHAATETKLTADLAAGTYRLSDWKVTTNLTGVPAPNGKVTLEIDTDASADLAKQIIELSKLHVTTKLADPSLPGGKLDLDVTTDVSADLAKQTLHARDLRIATGRITANGAIDVSRLMENPAFKGNIELARFNPRALLAELGQQVPETADPNVLTSASVVAGLQGTADRIQLQPLTVRLDDITLNGQVKVANFSSPAIGFDLEAAAINADRYLPPAEAQAQGKQPAPATPGAAASGASSQLPFDTLRNLNVDGKARIGKLTLAKLHLSDIALAVKAKGGDVRIAPVKVNLYQGNYAGNIRIDARTDKARVSLDEKLTGVQIGSLLRDLQGDDMISGQLRFALDVDATGATPEDLKKTLNGKAGFTFQDGMIKGIDVVHTICDAAGQIPGLSGTSTGEAASEGTKFQKLTGDLSIKNGRVGINNTLSLEAPLLRVRGESGNVDIGTNRFNNTKFIVKPAFTCQGQGGRAFDELSGVDVPISCNGPLEAGSCRVDVQAIINALANKKIEKVKEKAQEKIKEKLEETISEKVGQQLGEQLGEQLGDELGKKALENLGGALEGLFGR
uniref:AsmA protein n=1 Tax=Candidatus Kentrum sp. FM TaxID=2126340 RepID=A0A450SFT7_9GAMM|nr:MAG: AsmA protein [Candidatus Kentron sp. FM]VFJ52215.1 MAG: AsmA protein [Candidatus Kentron sp. FM]VFK09341.1 MAG: AsmA protein [Candidatus Kentron sp. FM]